ncbi:hypothetical protein BSZ39_02665 [Bowdeniella nasicola]|uniref:NodB homology domain-containing protein n=1 Tax=Bowdeniella nasicola TaxID=208480 RepID=A0A1Q5Q4V4_9ACTO|nr:hypothetical protein BSZ39_02665 [Bowdeniella nasicola]
MPAPPKPKPKPDGDGVDCSKAKCIALTFDDGPVPSTSTLLPILRKHHVHATFFMLGNSVAAHPDIAAAVAKDGHAIGNHTMTHPQLTKLSNDEIASELDRAAAQIEKATGKRPTLVRPPYGAQNARVLSVLRSRGESSILWSVDTLDWKHRNPATTIKRALASSKPGGIILMHDIHPTSVQAVEGVITGLKERGFTFVTVDQLHR